MTRNFITFLVQKLKITLKSTKPNSDSFLRWKNRKKEMAVKKYQD